MSAPDLSPDERATITERQMTDGERFSLLVSVMGVNASFRPATSASRRAWR